MNLTSTKFAGSAGLRRLARLSTGGLVVVLLATACTSEEVPVTGTDPNSVGNAAEYAAAVTVNGVTYPTVTITPTVKSLSVGAAASVRSQLTSSGGAKWYGQCMLYSVSDATVLSLSATPTGSGCSTDPAGKYARLTAKKAGTAILKATTLSGTFDVDTIKVVSSASSVVTTGKADPTLLPTATTQVKNTTAYNAIGVAKLAAGSSYRDPVTGVRVWRVTSASMPTSNPGAGHDYSEGPVQVSREWGGNKHTTLVRVDYSGYWLVDLTRGVGLSNWRRLPAGVVPVAVQAATFSQNPATPQILYVVTGLVIVRVNTATNRVENTGKFGTGVAMGGWLTIDKKDEWFVAMGKLTGIVTAWNSVTGQLLLRTFSGLDEPYFERDGRYVLANNGSKTSTVWDLATNTTWSLTAPGNSNWGHNPAIRGFFITYDVNTGVSTIPTWRVDPVKGATSSQISTLGGYAPDGHSAGQWVQENAELPGSDIRKQWFVRTTYDWSYKAYGNGVKEGIGFIRADGSDFRLLAHHYSVNAGSQDRYWSQPHGTISPDGKIVLFDSDMNNTASPNRNDLFAVEVPLR